MAVLALTAALLKLGNDSEDRIDPTMGNYRAPGRFVPQPTFGTHEVELRLAHPRHDNRLTTA